MLDKLIEYLRATTAPSLLTGIGIAGGIIAPGYLALLVYAPDLLVQLSFITSLLLVISLPVPFVLAAFFILSLDWKAPGQHLDYFMYFAFGSVGVVFYLWLLVSLTLGVSWKFFIWGLAILIIAMSLFARQHVQNLISRK